MMTELLSKPHTGHACPYCSRPLDSLGWYMPGMRMLADLVCSKCGRTFYGDLSAGHGLYYPMLLEKETGKVHDVHHVSWFSESLRLSYADRTEIPREFTEELFRPLRAPILLNCLDYLYGHSLLKLLNAQIYLDQQTGLDLVVLVPRFLRWMVPEGAAAVWTVDLPLQRGQEWNDWLAAKIGRRISQTQSQTQPWKLSAAFAHPHPADFDIARFTGVEPFSLTGWARKEPTITFIWRDDRPWVSPLPAARPSRLLLRGLRKAGLRPSPVAEQTRRVIRTANGLRRKYPALDFAVVGPGTPGGLPPFISDRRVAQINRQTEAEWCQRHAQSHVVIGVHGSNLLLPSALAGAVIDLMPDDRWGNLVQDTLPNAKDVREALCRYHYLPVASSAETVVHLSTALIDQLPEMFSKFQRPSVA